MARSGHVPSKSKSTRQKSSFKARHDSKRKTSAVSGYAKRHARKAARSEDVYEYAQEKVRRSKVALDLDREEERDAGAAYGFAPDDDVEDFRMKARLIGENGEDKKINSEDNEEIDSDDAFDEDDDERFAGFFSKKVRLIRLIGF
jgi:U3 small nucleolar RNA-associated protein 14